MKKMNTNLMKKTKLAAVIAGNYSICGKYGNRSENDRRHIV